MVNGCWFLLFPQSFNVVILLTHEITYKFSFTIQILLFELLANRFTIYYLLWLVIYITMVSNCYVSENFLIFAIICKNLCNKNVRN